MSFHEYSKEILTEYLGTVAYVDDLIFSKKEETKAVELKIESPRIMAAKLEEEESLPKQDTEGKDTVNKSDSPIEQLEPNINPAAFTNAFLEKGIHCSLFEIKNDDDSLDSLKNILKKTDIIILDWQMHQDNGRKASDLLLSVIESSDKPELRLFIIFTDDPQYKNLLSQTILPKLKEIGIINDIPENIECVFKFGHSKIVVLEKTNGKGSETAITDDQLPDRIIEEFTELTKGLVSNTALKAIISIDRNIHKLLAVFNKKLDPAYLSHKSLLPNSSDSLEHITDLLGSEIKSIIKSNVVQDENDTIKSYFDEKYIDWTSDFVFENREHLNFEIPEQLTGEMLYTITNVGIENYFLKSEITQDQKIIFSRNCHKNLTTFFTNNKIEADEANHEFAILTTLKSLNDKSEKILTQGTILKEDKKNPNYWLCIQPKCDSNRINTQIRDFLFLRLYRGKEDRFDIVLFDGEKLIIDYKVYYSRLMPFKTNGHNKILSFQENGYNKFLKQDNQKMIWIAELKNDFAQYISNNFAGNLSRVGMDHSEWLRRS